MSSDNDDATRVMRADGKAAGVVIPQIALGLQLGRGGMAIVVEGSDRGFNPPRRVAVKIMDAALSSDEEFRARFEAEASIVAGFRHPNIVQVYSTGETASGAKYMVMEYLPGGTLADRLRSRGRLDSAEAFGIAAELADALDYSHSQGIVHRDFKPANVLFAADGTAVLSDFGVAKARNSEQAALTRHASVIGAPRYMAPEQERAEEVSERTDIYSFGMTLYEMLTGTVPPFAVLVQLGEAIPQELEAKLAGHPAAVVQLIHRCLQTTPEARPSAAECRDRLRALAAPSTEASSARPRLLIRASIGTALAIVLGAGIYLFSPRSPEEVPVPPSTVRVTIARSPAAARVFVGGSEVAAQTIDVPTGIYTVAAVAPEHHGAVEQLAAHASPVALRLNLEPAAAITSLDVVDRFFELAEVPTITAADVDSIGERTLETVLRLKLLRQQGDGQAVDRELERLRTLQALGDDYAPAALLLDVAVQRGALETSLLTTAIVGAADRGVALAAYIVALAQRGDLERYGLDDRRSSTLFPEYCARMRSAADRGMRQAASFFLQQDGCDAP